MDNQKHCESCGASLRKYSHRLTPILVKALIKFRTAVVKKNENKIHLINDLKGTPEELEPYEWKNWTKVRFHGLVAKYKTDGIWERGYWLITHRGAQFLNGEISIPKTVQTYRNVIVARSEDEVFIKDVMGSTPYVEALKDIEFSTPTDKEINVAIEKNKPKKNKIKNPCPKCGEKMRLNIKVEYLGNVAKVVKKNLKCPKCGEEDFIL